METSPTNWALVWSAVGNIGQAVEAIVVLGGIVLIIWQLRQIQTEQKHSKWEALQWASSLFSFDDADRVWQELFRRDDLPKTERYIWSLWERMLTIISAIEDGYVDLDLYLRLNSSHWGYLKDGIDGWIADHPAESKIFTMSMDEQPKIIEFTKMADDYYWDHVKSGKMDKLNL
jgi:hypothetical protein